MKEEEKSTNLIVFGNKSLKEFLICSLQIFVYKLNPPFPSEIPNAVMFTPEDRGGGVEAALLPRPPDLEAPVNNLKPLAYRGQCICKLKQKNK